MLFFSFEFVLFFCIFCLLCHIIPFKYQPHLIAGGSLFFYGWWDYRFLPVPIYATAVAFLFAVYLRKKTPSFGAAELTLGICLTVAPLIWFKYFDFIFSTNFQVGLPIGISFITFSALAYIIDVKREDYKSNDTFLDILCFVSFFPQLIAGPILRPNQLVSQLKQRLTFELKGLLLGVMMFTLGLFKKLVIADNLAIIVDNFYGGQLESSLNFWTFLLVIYSFSVQIYCDFSGYTDMALGAAFILGVSLPHNFSSPYFARSLTEFWRKWHITLSSWFRDYVYLPLGGSRNLYLLPFTIVATFALSGLWHGAGFNFILWGLLHGLFVFFEKFLQTFIKVKIPQPLQVFITFNIVSLLWIIFRDPHLQVISTILNEGVSVFVWSLPEIQQVVFPLALIIFALGFHPFDNLKTLKERFSKFSPSYIILLLSFVISIAALGNFGSSQFIYFEF